MKRVLLFLLLAVPAGCASNPYPPNSPQAFCARQAEKDQVVRQLTDGAMSDGGPGPYQQQRIDHARYEAMQRCLLARGAAPPGGVEPLVRQ